MKDGGWEDGGPYRVKNPLQYYKQRKYGVFEDFTRYKGCYNVIREALQEGREEG